MNISKEMTEAYQKLQDLLMFGVYAKYSGDDKHTWQLLVCVTETPITEELQEEEMLKTIKVIIQILTFTNKKLQLSSPAWIQNEISDQKAFLGNP